MDGRVPRKPWGRSTDEHRRAWGVAMLNSYGYTHETITSAEPRELWRQVFDPLSPRDPA